jgi:hypothetical protein
MIGDELRAQLDALRSQEQVVGLRVDDYTTLIGLVHLLALKTAQRGLAWGRLGERYGEIAKADQDISEYLNRMVKVLVDGGQRARLDQERDVRMKTIRNALMGILLFALVALLIGAPAGLISVAQDATPSEEVATLVVTEPAPEPTLVVTVEPPVEPVVTPVEQIEATGQLLTTVLLFIGSIAAGTAVLMAFDKFLADRRTRQATEQLYLSQPPEAQERLANLADRVADIADQAVKTLSGISHFLRDVTDGKLDAQRVETRSGAFSDELAEAILKYGDRLKPPTTNVDREGGVG